MVHHRMAAESRGPQPGTVIPIRMNGTDAVMSQPVTEPSLIRMGLSIASRTISVVRTAQYTAART